MLFLICAHLVVDHHIKQHRNIVLVKGRNGGKELGFITIFRGNGAFLVELAEVKQIVAVVADGVTAGRPFVSRR